MLNNQILAWGTALEIVHNMKELILRTANLYKTTIIFHPKSWGVSSAYTGILNRKVQLLQEVVLRKNLHIIDLIKGNSMRKMYCDKKYI